MSIPAVRIDFDKSHTRFNEASGQQATLTKRRPAVTIANGIFFLAHIEGLQPWAAHHLRGVVIDSLVIFDARRPARAREILLQLTQQIDSPAKALVIDALR